MTNDLRLLDSWEIILPLSKHISSSHPRLTISHELSPQIWQMTLIIKSSKNKVLIDEAKQGVYTGIFEGAEFRNYFILCVDHCFTVLRPVVFFWGKLNSAISSGLKFQILYSFLLMTISNIAVLQLIPKSHISGRIDHIKYDEQIQADLERVDQY